MNEEIWDFRFSIFDFAPPTCGEPRSHRDRGQLARFAPENVTFATPQIANRKSQIKNP
jgi:hypothetical protein